MAKAWNERATFDAALALPDSERDAFLRDACPDDQARERIRTLLRHHAEASAEFLKPIPPPGGPAAVPERIDEFRILGRLGEGGMGIVYLAEDTVLGRKVALKVLAAHLAGSEQALARFRAEAKSAAALRHPAIVPVFKFGFEGQHPYIASEFVDGQTLSGMIAAEKNRRSVAKTQDIRAWHRTCAHIASVIADALDCSHRAGIVHRDVKPSNILIDREQGPRLTDFGIAKQLTEDARTRSTDVLGSCHYMSPEQASIANRRIDHRSDIFSLGVVLYEMLALERPFEGRDLRQVLSAIAVANPPKLRSRDSRIARDLETICHKALEKEPVRRYQTAAHMAADLRCFLDHRPILARPPGAPRRALQWVRTHKRSAALLLGVILLAGLAWLGVVIRQQRDARLLWMTVETGSIPCRAYLQGHDAGLLRPSASAEPLGSTPLRSIKRPPAHYRLVVVRDSDGAFCEFNVLPGEAGPSAERLFRVWRLEDQAAHPPVPGEWTGYLASAKDVIGPRTLQMPGGNYKLRREKAFDRVLQTPQHVPGFLIDKETVTNRQYKLFTDATSRAMPAHWAHLQPWERYADLPVILVAFEDAEAYARWCGKRLPTAMEWQAAARGADGRLYPGGDVAPLSTFDPDPCEAIDCYKKFVVPAHQPAPWDPPEGMLHTFSNTREPSGW